MNARRDAAALLLGVLLAACTGGAGAPSPTLAPEVSASPATVAPTTATTATAELPTAIPTPTATVAAASGEIAFTATVDGVEGIYLIDLASGRTTRLADGRGPARSPDGTRIAFGRFSNDGKFTLWTMNADGSGVRSLGDGLAAYWSPDGTRIAFSTSPIDLGDLWVMNADGSGRKQLDGGLGGAWSPDSARIASEMEDKGGGTGHIVVARIDGSKTIRSGMGLSPTWSPDGARIAFVSWGGPPTIQVVDPTTGTVSTIVQRDTEAHALAWSPDGAQLSFITPGGDLRVVSVTGGAVTTAATGLGFDAARSHDRNWFAFTVSNPESPTSDIYLSGAHGSDRRQLTTSGTASGPAWRPAPRSCNC